MANNGLPRRCLSRPWSDPDVLTFSVVAASGNFKIYPEPHARVSALVCCPQRPPPKM